MANASDLSQLLHPVQHACIAHKGQLTSPYEYIHGMRRSLEDAIPNSTEEEVRRHSNSFLYYILRKEPMVDNHHPNI